MPLSDLFHLIEEDVVLCPPGEHAAADCPVEQQQLHAL